MERTRAPFLALLLLGIALGLWAALRLIGWGVPAPAVGFGDWHGPLMVNGVLATMIGLERAVAVHRREAYLAPALSGLGTLALISPLSTEGAAIAWVASSAALTGVFLYLHHLQPTYHASVMVVGATALTLGNALWLFGDPISDMVLWWLVFLVLIITAERLELSRIFRPSRWKQGHFAGGTGLLVLSAASSLWSMDAGIILAASGLVVLSVWLLRYDVAMLNLRGSGRSRFVAVSLVSGYLWLLVPAWIVWEGGGGWPGLDYDAFLHSVFLGFVLSLVMAHSMIVLKALVGRDARYSPLYYLPWGIIQGTLVTRVVSDLQGWGDLRMWSGLLNVVGIVLFMALLGFYLVRDSLSWVREMFHPDFMNVQ